MILGYEFHPLAEKELNEAVDYYEVLEPEKGLELLQQVYACLEHIRRFPEAAPISRDSVRSIVVQPSQRWSYTVHYESSQNLFAYLQWLTKSSSRFIGFVDNNTSVSRLMAFSANITRSGGN